MKRLLAAGVICCALVTSMLGPLGMAAGAQKTKTPEEMAWEKVDSLNKQSLQDFLKQFPEGKFAQPAKLAVELQDKLASITQKGSKGTFAIPLDVLGETWKSWQQRNPDKGGIGYFVEKGEKYNTLGWFSPDPLSGGKTGGSTVISFDSRSEV